MYALAACAAASVARGIPKPTCTGWNRDAIRVTTALQAALQINRLRVKPIAIGLIPPSFLFSAHREAPHRTGWIMVGTRPMRHMFANSVSSVSRRRPASPAVALVRSLRCCGRSPSGPPAEPGTNDLMDDMMSGS